MTLGREFCINQGDCTVPFLFSQLLKGVTIASGGVLPRIHPELLSRKKGGKFPNQPVPTSPMPVSKKVKARPQVLTPAAKKMPPKRLSLVKTKSTPVKASTSGTTPKSPKVHSRNIDFKKLL